MGSSTSSTAESARESVAQASTSIAPAVGRLDHDLQRAAALAHGDANQLEAHADDGRGNDVFDSTQQFGHAGLFLDGLGRRASHK